LPSPHSQEAPRKSPESPKEAPRKSQGIPKEAPKKPPGSSEEDREGKQSMKKYYLFENKR
jgi:hypothetical protein